jgi:hypothetical protein
MRASGLYRVDQIRPVNELRMRARWKLGQILADVDRGHGPGRGKKVMSPSSSFRLRACELAEINPRFENSEARIVYAHSRELGPGRCTHPPRRQI